MIYLHVVAGIKLFSVLVEDRLLNDLWDVITIHAKISKLSISQTRKFVDSIVEAECFGNVFGDLLEECHISLPYIEMRIAGRAEPVQPT
jgi:hypothetical protein